MSTHNMGVNGKAWFALWKFTICMHFKAYILFKTWWGVLNSHYYELHSLIWLTNIQNTLENTCFKAEIYRKTLQFCRKLRKTWRIQYCAKYNGQEATYSTFIPDDTSPLGSAVEGSLFPFHLFYSCYYINWVSDLKETKPNAPGICIGNGSYSMDKNLVHAQLNTIFLSLYLPIQSRFQWLRIHATEW